MILLKATTIFNFDGLIANEVTNFHKTNYIHIMFDSENHLTSTKHPL
jgi:hypothetical protein